MAEYNINKFSYGSNTYKLEDDRMFMVTITEDDNTGNLSCDKTFNEIYAAYNEGKYIIGYAAVLHTYYYLKYIDGHGVYLEQLPTINDESHVIGNEGLFIDSYNQVEITGTQIVVPTTLCTDTQLNLGKYTTGGILTASAGSIQFSIPTGRVLSHTTISKISFHILARVGNSGTTAAANGLYILKSSSSGTSGVAIRSNANSSFYNGQNESKTITPSMWTTTIEGNTNISVTIASGSNNFYSGANYVAAVNNQPVAFEVNNIAVTLA